MANLLKRILIVDDEESIRVMLAVVLEEEGFCVHQAANGADALDLLKENEIDLILSDVKMPKMSGLNLLKAVKEHYPQIIMMMMSAYGSVDSALSAIQLGAYDYIAKPFKPAEIILLIRKAEEKLNLERENTQLKYDLEHYRGKVVGLCDMVAKSDTMVSVFKTIQKVAQYKSTVLIQGESGTGKELVARAIHQLSDRKDKPWITVNCGAIPDTLLESELFGHKKGAFTDATSDQIGLFLAANGGTIFLDEIGELPINLQVKLLRVLQEEEVRRVGESSAHHVDIRVIAATVRELDKDVEKGGFREDLFYRLNVLPITVPPLRARIDDIPLLVDHFIRVYNERLKTAVKGIENGAMKSLLHYEWPGNVRELENLIERAIVMTDTDVITSEILSPSIMKKKGVVDQYLDSGDLSIKKATRMIEEELIRRALAKTGGNRTKASKLLDISHRALLYKIKEFEIND